MPTTDHASRRRFAHGPGERLKIVHCRPLESDGAILDSPTWATCDALEYLIRLAPEAIRGAILYAIEPDDLFLLAAEWVEHIAGVIRMLKDDPLINRVYRYRLTSIVWLFAEYENDDREVAELHYEIWNCSLA